MISKLLIAILLGLVAAPAQPTEVFTIVGAGTASCGKYLDFRSDKRPTSDGFFGATAILSWTQGYISGMNGFRHTAFPNRDQLKLPDDGSIKAYLDKFCRDNPLKTIYDASHALYLELDATAS